MSTIPTARTTPTSQPSVVVRDSAPLLPKVAFTFITAASLLGVALTNRGLGLGWAWLVPRWLALWAGPAAIGFLAWRLLYLRRVVDDQIDGYRRDVHRRARTVGQVLGALATSTVPMALAAPHLEQRTGLRSALLVAGLVLVASLFAGVDRRTRAGVGLGAAAAAVVAWSLADAGGGVAAAWRLLHLTAFGLWIGGALWNLTVAVPIGARHPTVAAVTDGAEQLQRFRRVARVALPTVIATGALMALPYLVGPADLLGTTPGRYILAKVGLIAALVVIFITCPLYRQCSPVQGVCDLDDLDDERPLDTTARP